MIIYWIFWFIICIGTYTTISKKNVFHEISYYGIIIFLFLFIGFRYKVGGDWNNYLVMYDIFYNIDYKNAFFISDIGYSIINYISQYLKFKDTIFVNAICALVLSYYLYLSCNKLEEYWLFLLIYYPYHILVVSLGYTRQSVAVAIITYAFTFLIERKYFYFILNIMIAALFHKTAIIFILFIPLFFINKKSFLYLYEIISILSISILLYISYLYGDNMYTNSESEISSSGVFMRVSMHLIPILCYFIYFKNKKYTHDSLILNYFLALIILCCILAIPFSTLADRFNLYLVFFDIFILIRIFSNFKSKKRLLLITILVSYFTIYIYTWMFYGTWAEKAWIPYQNYLTNYLFENIL